MYTGVELGAAIATAIEKKGVKKAEVAREFGIKQPSLSDWIKTGRIGKHHISKLIEYFSDVVPPSHFGIDNMVLSNPITQNHSGNGEFVMKTIEETYRERLQLLITEYGGQSNLGKLIDKSPSQISQWVTGAPDSKTGKPRSLKSDTAREIENKLNLPHAWFDQPITTNTQLINNGVPNNIGSLHQDNYANVAPKNSPHLNHERMPDASMDPVLPENCELLIDSSQTAIINGKIYQIQSGELKFIRRIRLQIDGSLKLVCENEDFESFVVPAKSVKIIGRVVAWKVVD